MKKSLILAAFAAAGLVFAEEPLLKNGGFETTQKTPKGVHKYIQDQVKNGWDLGLGPIASYPKEWLPNGGKGKIRMIVTGENEETGENVHSGKQSMYIEAQGGHLMNEASLKPGKYEFSCWVKGAGSVKFAAYCGGIDKETKRPKNFRTILFFTESFDSPSKWIQLKKVCEIGTNVPGVTMFSIAFCGDKGTYYIDDVELKPVTK